MKIVCEACQAKYSIADDKVRGKVFKIRCKKCSHVIVVRGTGEVALSASGEFAVSANAAAEVTLDAGWHIVVDGEQVGPLPESDIRARLARGEITLDTYIWKEGLADWAKISSFPELSSSEGEGAAASASTEEDPFAGAATSVGAPADSLASASASSGMPDLFASPSQPAAARASGGGGGAFSGYENSPGPDPFTAARAGGNGAGGGGLTGQRHENSVLFSLSNLEALAKPGPGGGGAQLPAKPAPGGGPGATNTEGSGLIDIRAMANMTLGAQASAKGESKGGDLPAFSAPQFSPVAPVLLPQGATSGTPKWALAVLGFLGIVIVALGVVVFKIWLTPAPRTVAETPVVGPAASAPSAPPAAAPVAAAPAAAPNAETPPATPPPPANEALPPREGAAKAEKPEKPERPAKVRGKRGAGRAEAAAERTVAAAPARAERAAPEPPKKPKDDIEALLEAASGGGKKTAPAKRDDDDGGGSRGGEKLPPLTRDQIVTGMNAALPKARECYGQYKVPGTATVKLVVAPSGKVTKVTVTGKFAGTPSGACVENALKTQKFPPSGGRDFDYVVSLH